MGVTIARDTWIRSARRTIGIGASLIITGAFWT
jgi:hypothetical protein